MSPFSLGAALVGLTFMTVGALFLLDELGTIFLRTEIVIPGVVIALGLAAILGSLTRRPRG